MNLLDVPGNNKCADCGNKDVQFASINLGIILCTECSHIHKEDLPPNLSIIKSILIDNWKHEEIKNVSINGNSLVNSIYEANVPPCYRRPISTDPKVLKEQWIKSKYERKEFVVGAKAPSYLSEYKEGYLWKKGKEEKNFQRRRFILDSLENTIKYFNKEGARDPKATIRLDIINAMLLPEKIGNPNGMQLTFEQNDQTRNIFVYSEKGQEIVEWLMAIRHAKLNRRQLKYPGGNIIELSQSIMWDYIKEGWLYKTGPKGKIGFRKRWVTLERCKLNYYENPLDPFPKGEVFLKHSPGFIAELGFKYPTQGINPDRGSLFYFDTPARTFQFRAASYEEAQEWIQAINSTLEQIS